MQYLWVIYPSVIDWFNRAMAIEESEYVRRTAALQTVIDKYNDPATGRGGITAIAKQIDKSESYISRCLYPPGKAGRKRIGDDFVQAMNAHYPGWLAQQPDLFATGKGGGTLLLKPASTRDRRISEINECASKMSTEALLVLLDKARDLAREHPKAAPKTAS